MTSRKTQQEIDKTFKKVAEGIQTFEGIYEKIRSSTNITQRDKLEENLKREIKKLQRYRDQIKSWASGNEVKDKGPLMEQRRAIETCMEQFKAVEKEMKTKAYSKEGLSAASRLDPKEKEKVECCDFLATMVDELQQKIEAMEAEEETLHMQMKKGKKDVAKTNRLSDLSRLTERHKWHVNKLELLLRSVQNGNLEVNQVLDIKESIKYYVEDGHNIDYSGEDETLYDDLSLDNEAEAQFGIAGDNDRVSSQDTQSVQDDEPEVVKPPKPKSESVGLRRPSAQMKSPLPVLATLQTATATSATSGMKPAPPPTRLPGETLKYASAAAAAAASDKNGVGIAPLPPPPGASPAFPVAVPATTSSSKASATASPSVASAQPAQPAQPASKPTPPVTIAGDDQQPAAAAAAAAAAGRSKTPAVSPHVAAASTSSSSSSHAIAMDKAEPADAKELSAATNGEATKEEPSRDGDGDESIFHLPPGLQDLIQSFEVTKSRASASAANPSPSVQRLLQASLTNCPEPPDAEKPRHYKPQNPYNTPLYYPQEPLPIFDDPRLYETGRIDTDTLFYLFYYRQGTYQQYLAAKALKNQSWRFHKQYQTWFQRHEEPKTITEEFEQGTYRFFDYESTWMNRRKADFKFVYKYLEDEL
ncbi:CCR4-NOT transcription complex, subunit 3 [Aspergillus heteromorphus CBS 117.55]|uniref:General negative regulator of transcription subunit n=1 Tax=Aspergillus heteromorphus CBS 117.55 TaxID=1448321 RepID=A0A317X060_9EURO|nr:CCR4-NOT transcription complex, subunit 3 [Aspergillus heteromorphus CBS 117.55]PWY90962.1 CCR4-NOT transcription complex, subunit 3 [Aspergillus heteromorphus CBS 117.55]